MQRYTRRATTVVALFIFSFTALSAAAQAGQDAPSRAPVHTLDMTDTARHLRVLRDYSGTPDDSGILERYRVALPEYDRACYFSRDRRGANPWPDGANRKLPWVARGHLKNLFAEGNQPNPTVGPPNRQACFAIFQLADGDFLAIVPIAAPRTASWLYVDDAGRLEVRLGTLGTGPVRCDAPVVAWSRSDDVYRACYQAWSDAVTCAPVDQFTAFRSRKDYPELFKYLGWCSWEEYRKSITIDLLIDAVRKIRRSGLPVRYVLVDDGHLQFDKKRGLTSFEPNDKFPDGWGPLLDQRRDDGIRWMGLWHNFNGYWGTISPDNTFPAEVREALTGLPSGEIAPKPSPAASRTFYDAFLGYVADAGFDFVKIDNQAKNWKIYRGTANPVLAAHQNAQALESFCHRRLDALLNCMAHNVVCNFNTRYSAVTRCSIDYKLDPAKGKSHLQQSYNNTLWMGQTVWPDHDMFHSSDPDAGRMMAVSRALSGAPIYLSDAPEDFVGEYITPLCYEDGELLRPLAPAAPLPDSVCLDAMNEQRPYRVIAPLTGDCAAVVAHNLSPPSPQQPMKATVTPQDYTCAPGMMQPYPGRWQVPEDGLVYWDWYEGKGGRLGEDGVSFRLEGFSDRLVLLCPVRQGWAVVGRTDKYLSPAAVEVLSCTDEAVQIEMKESGPLAIYSTKGRPTAEGVEFDHVGGGMWKAEMPVGKEAHRLKIKR